MNTRDKQAPTAKMLLHIERVVSDGIYSVCSSIEYSTAIMICGRDNMMHRWIIMILKTLLKSNRYLQFETSVEKFNQ